VPSIYRVIEEWAGRRADACAVRDPLADRQLTYHELWEQSARVAHELRARGVARGDVVARLRQLVAQGEAGDVAA
jgi:acyl-CoA synthetase (AMP-forming)/AMP-acid ligase II